jgi:hypothetical protein
MYAMNILNDVIGLVLRENCNSKQVTDFIAWPSRCHGKIPLKTDVLLFQTCYHVVAQILAEIANYLLK